MKDRKVGAAIRVILNTKGLSLKCVRLLHESMFVTTLVYGSETFWGKKKV